MDLALDVKYFQNFLSQEDSNYFMNELKTYVFRQHTVKVKGKFFTPSRKICAFGDDSSLNYTFSGLRVQVQQWTPTLLHIKTLAETMCNCTFNYALLNFYGNGKDKIGMHKDDESSLDPNSPIAVISLGATRTMNFARKNFETEKLPLKNGSLLVMTTDVNKLWSHGIPSEPWISDARISITFRKLRTVKRESEENIHSAKRLCTKSTPNALNDSFNQKLCEPTCIETTLLDDGLDELFSSLKPELLVEKQGTAKCETIFEKDIGENVFLSCEVFNEQLKVHIRDWGANYKEMLHPTKVGLTMDLPTWYEFCLKLNNFNFCYTDASYIANNAILVLNMKDYMHIQPVNSQSIHSLIHLDCHQKKTLMKSIHEFNKSVIDYLLTKHLPHFIQCERKLLTILSSEEEDILLAELTLSIEIELSNNVLPKIYKCNGCIIDHPSEWEHACLMESNFEKYMSLGYEIILLANMETVASNFVNSVDFISENFIKNISSDFLKDVLFRRLH